MEGYPSGSSRGGGRSGRGRDNDYRPRHSAPPPHSAPASNQLPNYVRRDQEHHQQDGGVGAGRGSRPGFGRGNNSGQTGRGYAPAPEHRPAPGPNPISWSRVASHGRNQEAGSGQAQYRPVGAPGGGRGRGWAVPQPQPQPQLRPRPPPPPSTSVADIATTTDQFGAMALQPVDLKHGELVPMKRPDLGKYSAPTKMIPLLVNHFTVRLNNPSMVILHYDVAVKPEFRSRGEAALLMEQLLSVNLAKCPLAFDGQKNIYSAVPLPKGELEVQVSKEESRAPRTYKVTLQLVNQLSLSTVLEFLNKSRAVIPREVLQGLDVIMKENMRRSRRPIGGCFYPKGTEKQFDIGGGVVASKGVLQSLKSTSQGLVLCLDYSVNPFHKGIPVMEFLQQNLGIHFDKTKGLQYYEKRNVEAALKKLKVSVTHRKTGQKFVVMGLTKDEAGKIDFPMEDANNMGVAPRMMSLVQYYRQAYGKEVAYKCLPCLDLSKNKRTNYVPMEFCVLVEGQKYPKDYLDREQDTEFKYLALAKPADRKAQICEMVEAEDGPCGGGIIENFNIGINTAMTRVNSRVLNRPVLKVCDQSGVACKMFTQENGNWNLQNNKVLEGSTITRWAIIDFYGRQPPMQLEPFINSLVQRCLRLGIRMSQTPLFKEALRMEVLNDPNKVSSLLYKVRDRAEGKLDILVCVMADRHPGYKTLKRIAEVEVGIITQCCLRKPAMKPKNDQYLANLALKMNAKLGGATVTLFNDLPYLPADKGVMFIGADVNHPKSYDGSSHSIAAVVGTINWPEANKYAARFRIQDHRKEEIKNLGEMCSELISVYEHARGTKPEKIILFRDGVSESQFDMVLNKELVDVKRAINLNGYAPTITLVVAQKRHQTRLFPESASDGNVRPGTVVDTVIVDPQEFDFYLCSHNGILGTSKPTHYHVLQDEHMFTSSQLQEIFYNLCYTFARCTKPISLVPPVYYADLVAYRVRFYYESLVESTASSASSSSSWGSSLSPLDIEELTRCLKLHGDLENKMFFC